MGRNRTPSSNPKRKLKKLAISTTPSETQVLISSSSTLETGVDGGKSSANSKERTVKLVDVINDSLTKIYIGQAVSISDGAVYANGHEIGRLPKRTGLMHGNGRIKKVILSSSEVWITV